MSDVKLCIVCDSAISTSLFVTLGMQVIQPMVMRLQEKHPACKLTVGMVTFTTPTTRPAIVARRSFTQPTALFPLFRNTPHLLGIGTTGSGGSIGMAVLEGLVAAIEMCDEVLEAPYRRQRTQHPSIPPRPPRSPPIFHMLLIAGSRLDSARRPICNRSSSFDEITWETLPDELSKLWPTSDEIWFAQPKNYTILLAGTHMPNAKRQHEPPTPEQSTTSPVKRSKTDSPNNNGRPVPPKIDLPTLTPPQPSVPQPPSIPQPTSTAPNQGPDPVILNTYRQLYSVMNNHSMPAAQRERFTRTGFRIDESGAFIGAAGVILDSKGQPGVGAMVPPKAHALAYERARQMAAATGGGNNGAVGSSGARANVPSTLSHQQAMVAQMRSAVQQSGQTSAGQTQPATSGLIQPSQVSAPGQHPTSQPQPPQSDPVPNPNHASPSHHLSPSHTHAQIPTVAPSNVPATQPQTQPQAGPTHQTHFPAKFQPNAAPPAQPGLSAAPQPGIPHPPPHPPAGPGVPATPQQAAVTPHVSSTPQQVSGTPQNTAATPQQIGITPPHGTPQLAHSTPQATHSTPKFAHSTPQMAHSVPQAYDQAALKPGHSGSSAQIQQPSAPHVAPQNPGAAASGPVQNPGIPVNPTIPPTTNPAGAPSSTNVWNGQIVYLLQQRIDQEPATLQFSVIAAGGPHQNIETHRWPSRLVTTSGFKPLPAEMAAHIYSTPVPFGQITIDPTHSATDFQKWQVFQRVILSGWCIFYEFPSDPNNPAPNPAQGARGAFFFSTASAPNRVLFKAFINQLCPAALVRGGQPAGLKQTKNPNPPVNGNGPNLPQATTMGTGASTSASAAANAGLGVPVAGMGGAPSIAPGTGIPGVAPGSGIVPGVAPAAGIVPGAGVGMGARPTPAPTPPNVNPVLAPVPTTSPAGLNPALMQGLNAAGGMGLNAASMPGINPTGAARLGLNTLAQGGASNLNTTAAAHNANFQRMVYQMALAQLGLSPAKLATVTPQQKQLLAAQVQQIIPHVRAQLQQNLASGSIGAGMQPRPTGIPGGQPGLEHLQALIRQQQQQQRQ